MMSKKFFLTTRVALGFMMGRWQRVEYNYIVRKGLLVVETRPLDASYELTRYWCFIRTPNISGM
jgi:hypothetical protein